MSPSDIIRAWKNKEYYADLGAEEQALLPLHPAGAIVLNDDELEGIAGANAPDIYTTPDTCDLGCMSPYCPPTVNCTFYCELA